MATATRGELQNALMVMREDMTDVGDTLEGSHDNMPAIAAALNTVIENYPIIEEYLEAYRVTHDND